jgi:hypothetical protein
MTLPTACIRCKGTDLAQATFDAAGAPRVVVDATHSSPVSARVCLMCGAVMLTATEPAALRVGEAEHRDVQEYDF